MFCKSRPGEAGQLDNYSKAHLDMTLRISHEVVPTTHGYCSIVAFFFLILETTISQMLLRIKKKKRGKKRRRGLLFNSITLLKLLRLVW